MILCQTGACKIPFDPNITLCYYNFKQKATAAGIKNAVCKNVGCLRVTFYGKEFSKRKIPQDTVVTADFSGLEWRAPEKSQL